jgi:hypothetical protein
VLLRIAAGTRGSTIIIDGGTAGWVLTALAALTLIPVIGPGALGRRARKKRPVRRVHPLGPEGERMASQQERIR